MELSLVSKLAPLAWVSIEVVSVFHHVSRHMRGVWLLLLFNCSHHMSKR